MLSEETLSKRFETNLNFGNVNISEMFDFKRNEDVDECYRLLKIEQLDYKEGDSISVTGGSFEGFTGTVESVNLEEQTVDVIVSMFGRETPVSLPITQVAKLD